ncbi:L,D-transpeptidase [Bacillus sp. EB106-08-02-XG196]|jgi:lipoprotein-anchoring transpeptidase ErfK/SrfK|uniref:L,D-transpeptidase n=1 Tax=Bacillus sp. EB106-08-02-XG196 TaxID=2737049 RepID=UPI0015C4D8DE|nr:L,D-transpeptidase [Bacillus sp. EB106-08-02-XG196]NWQ39919.1 L,D-transpeptidase [Bacillus sp. EB106-08-02-XG196]
MIKILSPILFAFFISPLWPLGPNPLPGDPFVIVNKTTNELALIDDNRVQTVVSVGTGKTKDLTPEGLFTITIKAEDPYYRRKDIPGGDPENPLGSRWIGFDAQGTDGRIYGIHGTNQPASIGRYVSLGCIRTQNEVISSLYPIIPLGTKILVTSTNKTFEQLGVENGAIDK